MIQIISGEKGKGKTKVLIDKANSEVKASKGSIVYLDKSNKHMYELSNKIRLINVKDYLVENYNEFLGFICGIISQDSDLEKIYLDSFLKISCISEEQVKTVLTKLNFISEQFNMDFVISLSMDATRIPELFQKNVIVSL